ncbi:peroxiredoxin [Falsirhodobacter algicola]|uniref:Glutathione-dependent peroxiredoxin n=1 Tax=Falsirhodobacter algicola TaxID=2692330 RepID=A0A8J8MSM1_9RHOB|nr:peroxiredoxin [Falsirhodobacter algicola]QUS35960.1 redoxin family protein [Falsirhodobacter algicola]
MTIAKGDRLPGAQLVRAGADGVEQVDLARHIKGRNVVIFAVPGAFTPTCHSAHMPGFVRHADALRAKGVEEIICISVNDAFVMKAWGEATGALDAGLTLLGDPRGEFTQDIGMAFDAPGPGLMGRSRRYAMHVVDGEVRVLHLEESPGTCEVSGADMMLQAV